MEDRQIDALIELLTRLPGMGPRSARRVALYILSRKDQFLTPLREVLSTLETKVILCEHCFIITLHSPCAICSDARRKQDVLCVVEETSDVWALERAGAHRGVYHILGGCLNALENISPEDLHIDALIDRVQNGAWTEIILATSTTIEGQSCAYYLADRLANYPVRLSRLARGLPMGSELEYMDEGTLADAIRQRRPF